MSSTTLHRPRPGGLAGLTTSAARHSARHPRRTIALWLLCVVAAATVLALVPTQRTSFDDGRLGESGLAADAIDAAGLTPASTELVVLTGPSADRREAARQVADRAAKAPGVEQVTEPTTSSDGTVTIVPVEMSGTPDDASDHVDDLLGVSEAVQRGHPDLEVRQTGAASIDAGIMGRVGEDLAAGESRSLPVTFVILLVAFGALIAAGIPLVLAIGSVVVTLGLYAPLSRLVPDSGTVVNVVLMLALAVGIDYSLFYLRREREERRRGAATVDAIQVAAATSGHAVVVSGLTVMIAMSGLLLMGELTFAGLAVGSILVVAVSVLGSITVLPALLSLLGRWVDRPRVPFLHRLTDRLPTGAISGRLLRPVLANPRVSAVLTVVVLGALSVPALTMDTRAGGLDSLPQDIPAVQAQQRVEKAFPEQRPTIDLVAEGGSEASRGQRLDDVARSAGVGDGRVESADRTSVLTAPAPGPEGDQRNADLVRELRAEPGQVLVGGDVAEQLDLDDRPSRLPWVVAFVLGLTLVSMGWVFRSAVIAVLTTALNLLSVGTAFGVMVLTFQTGWFDGAFTSPPYLVDWVPVFCFVLLVGLSMDYHVFVLSRVREHVAAGRSMSEAVSLGVRQSAGAVTSAGLVMISVFAVYGTLSMAEMQQMGVGLSAAILVDATLVRLVLLPAALLLLQRPLTRSWGPRPEPTPVHEPVPVPANA